MIADELSRRSLYLPLARRSLEQNAYRVIWLPDLPSPSHLVELVPEMLDAVGLLAFIAPPVWLFGF